MARRSARFLTGKFSGQPDGGPWVTLMFLLLLISSTPGGAGRRAADRALLTPPSRAFCTPFWAPNWPAPGSVICALPLWWWGCRAVRPLDLEKYIAPNRPGATAPELSLERWTLELYRSLIDSLQSIAWMLLLFYRRDDCLCAAATWPDAAARWPRWTTKRKHTRNRLRPPAQPG